MIHATDHLGILVPGRISRILMYWAVISPFEISRPAAEARLNRADVLGTIQPASVEHRLAFRIACATNFGVPPLKNTFAPLAFSAMTCRVHGGISRLL